MISIDIEINGENKLYEFPTSWDEINISTYKKLHQLDKPESENDLLYLFEIINVLSNIDKEILYQMDINQFQELSKQLSFIYDEVKNNQVDYVEVDGEKYYLYTDFNKYNAGEIISIDTILKRNNYDYISCMSELCCIFLRKKIDDKIEPFNTELLGRKNTFDNLKVSDVNNVFSFFLFGGDLPKNNTKDSTKAKNPKKKVSSRKS